MPRPATILGLTFALAGIASSAAAQAPSDAKRLEGTWRATLRTTEGKPSILQPTDFTWTWASNTVTVKEKGKVVRSGACQLDESATPHRMSCEGKDSATGGMTTLWQIYRFLGDTLNIAYSLTNRSDAIPRNFDVTNGIIQLKLVKVH